MDDTKWGLNNSCRATANLTTEMLPSIVSQIDTLQLYMQLILLTSFLGNNVIFWAFCVLPQHVSWSVFSIQFLANAVASDILVNICGIRFTVISWLIARYWQSSGTLCTTASCSNTFLLMMNLYLIVILVMDRLRRRKLLAFKSRLKWFQTLFVYTSPFVTVSVTKLPYFIITQLSTLHYSSSWHGSDWDMYIEAEMNMMRDHAFVLTTLDITIMVLSFGFCYVMTVFSIMNKLSWLTINIMKTKWKNTNSFIDKVFLVFSPIQEYSYLTWRDYCRGEDLYYFVRGPDRYFVRSPGR